MSRSGYSDDADFDTLNLYRGNVDRALSGRRGQAFLKEMLAAFDAMPEKKLLANLMQEGEQVCSIGAVGKVRGVNMTTSEFDPDNYEEWEFGDVIARTFDIASPMAREIMWENDGEAYYWKVGQNEETPEQRFARMRAWVASQIREPA